MDQKSESFKSNNSNISKETLEKRSILESFMSKRRNITRISWIILSLIAIVCVIFITPRIGCVLFASLISLACIITILFTYINTEFFSIDAYITIPILYTLTFLKIIIISADIAALATYKNKEVQFDLSSYLEGLNIAWIVIYWLSIIFGSIITNFQTYYWMQGYSTVGKNILGAFKKILLMLAIVVGLGAVVLIYLIIKLGFSQFKNIVMNLVDILNLIYTFIFLIVLLGFGIVEVPLYFLLYTDTDTKVKQYLNKLIETHEETLSSINIYNIDKEILEDCCKNVLKKQGHPVFRYAKDILSQLEGMKIETNELFPKDSKYEALVKKPDDFYEDNLADIYIQVKEDFFLATKNFRLFMKTFNYLCEELQVFVPLDKMEKNSLSDTLIAELSEVINTEPSFVYIKKNRFNDNKSMFIVPKNYNMCLNITTKTIGFIVLLIAILIVAIQITLVDSTGISLMKVFLSAFQVSFHLTFFFVLLFTSFIFLCCYFALTQFKIMEDYLIVKHHTNKMGMALNARLCDTLVFGITYNLIAFVGPLFIVETPNSLIEKLYLMMKSGGFIFTGYYYYFPIILVVIILLYVFKKFNLFCFKNEYANKYFTKSFKLEIPDDIAQKAYKIMQKIEKIYNPSLLEHSVNKITNQNSENNIDKPNANNSSENIDLISVKSDSNIPIESGTEEELPKIIDEFHLGFKRESKSIKLKEVAFMQGYLGYSTNKSDKPLKKYVKLMRTRLSVAENREGRDKIEINLKDITILEIENRYTLLIDTKISKLYITSLSSSNSEKEKEITQWKEAIENYKKMVK